MVEPTGVTEINEVAAPEPAGPTLDDLFGEGRASVEEAVAEAVVEGDEAQHQPRAEPEAPPPVIEEGEQPRDELGRFAEKEVEETPDIQPAAEDVELPVVTLEDAEGEFDLEFDDPGVADAVTALKERAAQVDDLEARAIAAEAQVKNTEAAQADLIAMRQEMRDDPIAFLSENVRPELRQELVIDLLMDDEIYKATLAEITQWESDPRNRELKAAQRGEHLANARLEGRERRQQSEMIASRSERIVGTVQSFIPESMAAEDARHFFQDMIRDVQEHVRVTNTNDMSDADIEKVVARRFRQYDVDGTRNSAVARDPSGAIIAEPADENTRRIVEARKAGARLREKHQRRQAAGATAPGGSGSPVTRAGPPKGASLDEALDFARRNLAR